MDHDVIRASRKAGGLIFLAAFVMAISVCPASAAPVTITSRPQGDVGPIDTLLRLSLSDAHVHHRALQLDEFADPPGERAVVGRSFRLVLKFSPAFSASNGASYVYKDGLLRLQFFTTERSAIDEKDGTHVTSFASRAQNGRSYIATNAFGVQRTVQVVRTEEDGIAYLKRPAALETLRTGYLIERALSAPQARQLASEARVVIEGSVQKWPDGMLAKCDSSYGGASINRPTESISQRCSIGASVDRIAIFNARTREVLQEWVYSSEVDDLTKVARHARARANLASLISDGDYPSKALKLRREGTTTFMLTVEPNGRVSACNILTSSGEPSLDEAACRLLQSRATFTPAVSAAGKPASDVVKASYQWRLPK